MGRNGFGIPVLVEIATPLLDAGLPVDEVVDQVAYVCELRSEAIEALRAALQSKVRGDNHDSK